MNRTNLKALSTAIASALVSRKSALQLEVAVCFAVHMDCNQSRRLSRAMLCEIYTGAGVQCSAPGELEWKSTNRRITAGLAMFDFIGAPEVLNWIDGRQRKELLDAIVAKLEPLKLGSVEQILQICDKSRTRRPNGARAEPAGTHHIDTAHLKIVIPPGTPRAELREAGIAMMQLAERLPEAAPAVADDKRETDAATQDEAVEA